LPLHDALPIWLPDRGAVERTGRPRRSARSARGLTTRGGVMAEVEPMPFATVDDLKARWPDMPPGSDEHAETLLEDASEFILDVCLSAASARAGTRRRIVCVVVRRSMEAQASPSAG